MTTQTFAANVQTGATRASPYQGLVPYAEADADWFFGREEWCGVIGDNLRAYRITVLYGASGCGKSSVLRAGLARRLRDEAHDNVAALSVPRLLPVVFSDWSLDDPLGALRGAVDTCARELATNLARDEDDGSLAESLGAWPARIDGPLLLILDQLEELFRYHDQPDSPVLAELGAVLRSRDPAIHFLLSTREDSLAQLDRFKGHVPGLLDHLLRLEHLDRDAAREAIVEPLLRWNRTVAAPGEEVEPEPSLVDAVLDQVTAGQVSLGAAGEGAADDGVAGGIEAPYLQLVLTRLWDEEHRRWSEQGGGSRLLRLETLERLGGAERIVRTHLDTALAALPVRERDLAGRTLRYLVTPSGTKIALRTIDLAEYAHVPEERIDPLIKILAGDVRILRGAGDGRYEIYHDALAGPILDWRARWEERQRRRREQRRFVILGAVAVVLAAIAVGIAILAIQARHAQHAARISQSNALAAQAVATLDTDPAAGLETALQAVGVSPTSQAEGALRSALAGDLARATLHGDVSKATTDPVFSPDGKLIVTIGADKRARVWEAESGHLLHSYGNRDRPVWSAAFSPDGKLLVTAGAERAARVWQSPSGHLLHTLQTGVDDNDAVFSPNGKLILTSSRNRARVWDTSTGRLLHTLTRHVYDLTAVFSPNSKLIISVGDSAARVWDAGSGRPLYSLTGAFDAISRDSKLIVTTADHGAARVWDSASGHLLYTIPGGFTGFSPSGRVIVTFSDQRAQFREGSSGRLLRTLELVGRFVAFGPHGNLILTIENRYDGTGAALAWGSQGAVVRRTFRGDNLAVSAAVFSPDGRLIMTTGYNGTAWLWEVTRGQLVQTMIGHRGEVRNAAFSPDGTLIVTAGGDGTARVWANSRGDSLRTLKSPDRCVDSAAFSPNGRRILGGGFGCARSHIWNAASGRLLHTLTGSIVGGASSPDGKLIVTLGEKGTARVWDSASGRLLHTLTGVRRDRTSTGPFAAFSPNGKLIVTLGEKGAARVWDSASGRLLHTLSGHAGDFEFLASPLFSPDSKLIVAVGDSSGRVWDAASGRLLHTLRGQSDYFTAVLSPDGKLIVTPDADTRRARVWDFASGKVLHTLKGHTGSVRSAAFSRDGKLIVTASGDGTARVWESASGHLLHTLRGHTGRVRSAAFSPDGELILTVGDRAARVWDSASGRLLHTLTGHSRLVFSAAFSPDGKLIVTVSADGTARVWDSATGGSLKILTGHTDYDITSAAFSPNGKLIVTTGDNGTARVWLACDACGVPLDKLLVRARNRVRATS